MKNTTMITTVAIVVAAAAVSFFGGMKFQQSRSPMGAMMGRSGQFAGRAGGGQFGGPGGQNGGTTGTQGNRGGTMAFRPINGEITSSDDTSVTVKLQDGSSKIVLFSDSTQINKADQATKDDLKTGAKVAVFGQTNPDGSVTAQNIQLNPITRQQASPESAPAK